MTDSPVFTRRTLLAVTLVLEGVLLLIGAVWARAGGIELAAALEVKPLPFLIGAGTAIGTVTLSLLFYRLGQNLPFFSDLRKLSDEVLTPIVSRFTFWDIILISLASGICEEVLFRGVVMPSWGLVVSSVLFGFVHSPTLKYFPYVVVTVLAGFLFGYLYIQTGSLWTPIVAHVLHNAVSLGIVRFRHRGTAPGKL